MATATQIKELLKTHGEGNDDRFYAIALQVAAAEARKGHQKLADEIHLLVDRAKKKRATVGMGEIVHVARPQGEVAELVEQVFDNRTFTDLVLDSTLAERIERITREQKNAEEIKSHGLKPRQKLLFTGPPGCGKTFAASALANALNIPLFVIRLDSLITRYLGESLTKLRIIFDAINRTRAIYLFDEFDSIGFTRDTANDVGEMRRVLNGFLVNIEAIKSDSIVIAATNFGQKLDHALYRRFDDLVVFGLPGNEEIGRTIQLLFSGVPTEPFSDDQIFEAARGLSYSEITRACEEAIKEKIISGLSLITTEMLVNALTERRLVAPQLTE